MDQPLQTTLVDLATFLQSHGVPFALVGGLAASLRGQPRVTADVDVVIVGDLERALEIVPLLSASKFRPLFSDIEDVVTTAFILPLRHRTTGIKVDIAIGLSGFERQLVDRATLRSFGAAEVHVATAEDLLVMKVLAGRPQDEEDVQGIVMAQGENLDWEYCLGTAAKLQEAIGQDLVSKLRVLQRFSSDG